MKVNELARSKLAHKHGLRVESFYRGDWVLAVAPAWIGIEYRVHPVTQLMSTKQLTKYLDQVYVFYTEQGFLLTQPQG